MRSHECPTCRLKGRLFEQMSRNAWFDFYRCSCGFVWTIARKDDDDLHGYEVTARRLPRSRAGVLS